MRTGIIAWLRSLKKGSGQKDSATLSFSSIVFDSLEKSSGKEEDVQPVLDSLSDLKDSEQKELLVNAVKDCFDNKELSLQHKEELSKQFDSMYVSISGDSIKEIIDSFNTVTSSSSVAADTAVKDTANAESSDARGEVTEDSSNKEAEKEEKKDEEDKKAQKDSAVNLDSFKQDILKDVKAVVTDTVKELLNIDDKKSVKGASLDSSQGENPVIERDYGSFLDRG